LLLQISKEMKICFGMLNQPECTTVDSVDPTLMSYVSFDEGDWTLHPCKHILIYIIIWLSLYVLSVHFPTSPKPAGLDPPNFRRRTLYYTHKSLGKKVFFNVLIL
jgi:hypothetical protein